MMLKRLKILFAALLFAAPALAQGVAPALKPSSGGTGSGVGNISTLFVSPSGAGSYTETLGSLAAQSGVLLDAFKQSGDADDTAALNRALTACVPVLLGPRTYAITGFNSGTSCPNFVMKGIPGKSVVQRQSVGTGNALAMIGAANVYIDGVTFDMNSSGVTTNQWGVFIGPNGGQNVAVRNSVFKNNVGTLGSCFTLVGVGPGAGGGFTFENNEVSGCGWNSVWIGSVSNGRVTGNYIHDTTTGDGLFVGGYGTVSSTNYAANILVSGNRFARNYNGGAAIGTFSAPFTFGTPDAVNISVQNNIFTDNGGYQLSLQGDHTSAQGNIISQTNVTPFGGILCNARWVKVEGNDIKLSGASYGSDCGGAVGARVAGNRITLDSGQAVDMGGTQNSVLEDNDMDLSGSALAGVVTAVEQSGNQAFPTITSGLVIRNNRVNMAGSTVQGFQITDNAGGYSGAIPTIVENNKFVGSAGASAGNAINYFAASLAISIQGNTWNGSSVAYVDPNGNGDVLFDNVYDEIRGYSSSANIRQIATNYISQYSAGGSVLYIYPTSGGSGYNPATTTVSVSGTGCTGVSASPQINNGVVLGVKVTGHGSGCSGTVTASITGGGGSGAVLAVATTPALPAYRRIRYYANGTSGNLLKVNAGTVQIAFESYPLQLTGAMPIDLQALASGLYWNVLGYRVPTYFTGSLPTCNATSSGALITIANSSSGKWSARCNSAVWIYPDGSTAP